MSERTFHPLERVFRYGISGVLVSLIFSFGVIGFVHVIPSIGPIGASILAFIVVQPIGYVIHRTFSFPDAELGPTRTRASMLRFIFTNLGSITVAAGGMALVTNVFHASYLWGIALNWVLIPCTNFLVYRIWVFELRSGRGGKSA